MCGYFIRPAFDHQRAPLFQRIQGYMCYLIGGREPRLDFDFFTSGNDLELSVGPSRTNGNERKSGVFIFGMQGHREAGNKGFRGRVGCHERNWLKTRSG